MESRLPVLFPSLAIFLLFSYLVLGVVVVDRLLQCVLINNGLLTYNAGSEGEGLCTGVSLLFCYILRCLNRLYIWFVIFCFVQKKENQ